MTPHSSLTPAPSSLTPHNSHALHSSGCLKGKASPLSIAATLISPPWGGWRTWGVAWKRGVACGSYTIHVPGYNSISTSTTPHPHTTPHTPTFTYHTPIHPPSHTTSPYTHLHIPHPHTPTLTHHTPIHTPLLTEVVLCGMKEVSATGCAHTHLINQLSLPLSFDITQKDDGC